MTLQDLQAKMERWRVEGPKALKVTLTRAAEMVRKEAQSKHLSGPKMPRGVGSATSATLQPRTSRLRTSIALDVQVTPELVRARVGTNVSYAAIHEFGGTVKVAARSQLALMSRSEAWSQGISGYDKKGRLIGYQAGFAKARMSKAKMRFATMRLLGEHTVTMPERAYLRPSLAAQHDRIFAMIEADWMASYG